MFHKMGMEVWNLVYIQQLYTHWLQITVFSLYYDVIWMMAISFSFIYTYLHYKEYPMLTVKKDEYI